MYFLIFRIKLNVFVLIVSSFFLVMTFHRNLALANEISCSSIFTHEQCVFINTLIQAKEDKSNVNMLKEKSENEISNLMGQIKRNKVEVKILKFQLKRGKQKSCSFINRRKNQIQDKNGSSISKSDSFPTQNYDERHKRLRRLGKIDQDIQVRILKPPIHAVMILVIIIFKPLESIIQLTIMCC